MRARYPTRGPTQPSAGRSRWVLGPHNERYFFPSYAKWPRLCDQMSVRRHGEWLQGTYYTSLSLSKFLRTVCKSLFVTVVLDSFAKPVPEAFSLIRRCPAGKDRGEKVNA